MWRDYNFFREPLPWVILEFEAILFASMLERMAEPAARWAIANAINAGLNSSKIRRAEYLVFGDRL